MVLLTHGHLDHVGYLPRLVMQGLKVKILGTASHSSYIPLCAIMLEEIILRDSQTKQYTSNEWECVRVRRKYQSGDTTLSQNTILPAFL